jgi:hypothetical protein
MKVTVTRCDFCQNEIPDRQRRFTFKGEVFIQNGFIQNGRGHGTAIREFPEICSEQCLTNVLAGMIREAERAITPSDGSKR